MLGNCICICICVYSRQQLSTQARSARHTACLLPVQLRVSNLHIAVGCNCDLLLEIPHRLEGTVRVELELRGRQGCGVIQSPSIAARVPVQVQIIIDIAHPTR